MKERISLFAVLFLLMAAASLFSMCGQEPDNLTTVSEPEPSSIPSVTETSSQAETVPQSTAETATIPYADFRILDESTGEILTVTNLDFLPGAIAVEMPLTYPEEALKAQAVASYTYYSRLRQQNRTSESPADADFSADPDKGRILPGLRHGPVLRMRRGFLRLFICIFICIFVCRPFFKNQAVIRSSDTDMAR